MFYVHVILCFVFIFVFLSRDFHFFNPSYFTNIFSLLSFSHYYYFLRLREQQELSLARKKQFELQTKMRRWEYVMYFCISVLTLLPFFRYSRSNSFSFLSSYFWLLSFARLLPLPLALFPLLPLSSPPI
jgi:hypothetical protein